MKTYIVDTHTLVWFLSNDKRLSESGRSLLQDLDTRLVIPVIVLAEVKHLGQRGRFSLSLDDVILVINNDPRCVIYPIDIEVVRKSPPELDIHDSLIVGTALAQPDTVDGIITADEAIRKANLVPVVW